MQAPRWRQKPLTYLIPLFVGSFLLALILALNWPRPHVESAAAPAPVTSNGAALVSAPPPIAATSTELPREAATPTEAVALRSFEDLIDDLVRLGQRTAELAQQDDVTAATESDQQSRARFGELMERFEDAGERAIGMATTLVGDPASPTTSGDALTSGRRIVLQLVLRTECERRHSGAAAANDYTRINALVQAALDVMPSTPITALVGEHVLNKQRFLRAVHEPSVLGLVKLAAEERFPREIATQLLLTLWDNLQLYNERSSDEMSRLALLLLTDSDPSQRTAACRQLLKDPRYRGLVLAWLREHNDTNVANEIAGLAARELPPAEALALLRELAPILPRATSAYMVLGFRAPEAVADNYRELLATNTNSNIRCDLVSGVGMARTPLGLEVAQLALQNDPSLDVRMRAVFALTSRGEPGIAEKSLMQAFDDPRLTSDPIRVGSLVLALQNLEASGDMNAIDRLGQRLRGLAMDAKSRETLEAILHRCLPGGQSATPGGSPR